MLMVFTIIGIVLPAYFNWQLRNTESGWWLDFSVSWWYLVFWGLWAGIWLISLMLQVGSYSQSRKEWEISQGDLAEKRLISEIRDYEYRNSSPSDKLAMQIELALPIIFATQAIKIVGDVAISATDGAKK
jgi:hypothetical protein